MVRYALHARVDVAGEKKKEIFHRGVARGNVAPATRATLDSCLNYHFAYSYICMLRNNAGEEQREEEI